MANHGVRDLWTIPIAARVAGGIGLLAGVPALRLSGLYLALATFGIAVVLPDDPEEVRPLHGRLDRHHALRQADADRPRRRRDVLGRTDEQPVALRADVDDRGRAFLVAWWLLASRFGRVAARGARQRARRRRVGRQPRRRTRSRRSASRPRSPASRGALLAINVAYVSPDTFPIQLSLYLLVGAVVGFFGSIWGAVLGALLIQFLPDIVGLIPHVDTKQAGPTTFFFGAVLVALMLVLPLVAAAPRATLTNRGYSRAQ